MTSGWRCWSVPVFVLALSFLLVAPVHAAAPSAPGGPGEAVGSTSVSLAGPAEPLTITPGGELDSWVLVGNSGPRTTVRLSQVALVAGFDGQLEAEELPEPLWAGQVDLPAQVQVPAGGERRIRVHLRVPAATQPNL